MKRLVIGFVAVAMAIIAWRVIIVANSYEARWQQVENIADCVTWNKTPQLNDTMTWTGECKDGHTNGSGEFVWRFMRDGEWMESTYTGEMANGKRNGHGVAMLSGVRYVGSWKNGTNNGHGVYTDVDHTRYEGDFVDGKFEGRGNLRLGNHHKSEILSTYYGEFKGGEMHGRGVLGFGLTHSKFCDAEWSNGEFVRAYNSGEGACERLAGISE